MIEVLLKLLPLFILIVIGAVLKKIKLLSEYNANLITKFVFYITLPATVFLSVSKVSINEELIVLPLSSAVILILTYFASKYILDKINFEKDKKKVILSSTIMLNLGFLGIPIFNAIYGDIGVAYLSLFDISCGIIIYTLGNYIVSKKRGFGSAKNILLSPPFWAVIIGIFASSNDLSLPIEVNLILGYLASLTTPLIMIAMGAFITFKIENKKEVLTATILRVFLGLILGIVISYILGLEGLIRNVIIIASMFPSAVMTFIFASKEGLDKKLAIEIITVSTIVAMILLLFLINIM
ncbi:MAG: AEC family transporter [Candidatus ainarchaeum sp.]|nr:AEC family transporter [Candidatus ainarchaeum sp.]